MASDMKRWNIKAEESAMGWGVQWDEATDGVWIEAEDHDAAMAAKDAEIKNLKQILLNDPEVGEDDFNIVATYEETIKKLKAEKLEMYREAKETIAELKRVIEKLRERLSELGETKLEIAELEKAREKPKRQQCERSEAEQNQIKELEGQSPFPRSSQLHAEYMLKAVSEIDGKARRGK